MSGTGLDTQCGLKTEAEFGTPVVVDTFQPIKSQTLTDNIDLLVSEAIVATRMTRDIGQVKQGMHHVTGSIEMDLHEQGAGKWLYHLLGGVAESGAGPYVHTLTPGTGRGLGFTIQMGVPDVGGTVRPYTFAGCKVVSGTLSAAVGSPLSLKVDVIGTVIPVTATGLASVSYVANATVPMSWANASASVGGAAVAAQAFELNINGQLPERAVLGRNISKEPLRSDRFEVSGKVTTEFEDLTETAKYQAGTALNVVLSCDDSVHSTVATIHTVLTGALPTVSGPGIVAHDLMWSDAFGSTDAAACTIVCTDDQATV